MSVMQPNIKVVPPSPHRAKPLLRWAGGKSWFVKEFGDDFFGHVLKRGGKYIEPFLGGAAVALHFGLKPGFGLPWSQGEGCAKEMRMILADAEIDIAHLYAVVRDEPESLIALLSAMQDLGTDAETYYHVRNADPQKLSVVERGARVLYLNRLCFNGLYRKNASGGFNVAYGKKEKPLQSAEHIRDVSLALQGAEIYPNDFELIMAKADDGDTVYLDPPYDIDGHTDYTAKGFDHVQQRRLARAAKRAFDRGADVFAHNADTPFIRELWGSEGWAKVLPMLEGRAINSKGDGRGAVPCVFVVATHEEW